ncbi:MAG: hypothetical protein K8T26_05815 [Lentisphaerae bacterium]|nr:hypothetical protein [Lentisphaerota bacterium]
MSIDPAIMGRTLPGIILAAMFFALGLGALGNFGVTWDEDETYPAGLLHPGRSWSRSVHLFPCASLSMGTLLNIYKNSVRAR